ncbi:MAG: DUF4422 domain-containing protein [Candidatus Gastranaerophilaceae bacterium]
MCEKKDINIAVCYHKNCEHIENDVCTPIHVGRILADEPLANMIGDDTGDNISYKNFSHAELTAIYWLWKNSNAEFKGLMHYRRFLDLSGNHNDEDYYNEYIDENFNGENFLNKLQLNKDRIQEILKDNVIITRKEEDLRVWSNFTVQEHYKKEHYPKHLDTALKIIKTKHKYFYKTAKNLLKGTKSYFTNMVIMKTNDFNDYAKWLFDILDDVEKQTNPYLKELIPNTKQARWAGFLAERLTSIYIIQKHLDGNNIYECPAVMLLPKKNTNFYDYDTYHTENSQSKEIVIENNTDKNKPKVSVCIACYNVARYLKKCLDSVINQSLKNIEIICVNDGSTDKTLNILEEYAQKDARIKIISQSNQGLGIVRNVGKDNANGEYIHFLDGDDYLDTDFLLKMVERADKNNSDIVISTHKLFSTSRNYISNISTLPHTLYGENLNIYTHPDLLFVPCHVWDKIYNREFLKQYNFPKDCTGEDIPFWWSVITNAKKVSILRTPRINYRFNENSIQTQIKYIRGVWKNVKLTERLLENAPDFVKMYFYVFKKILVPHMRYRAQNLLSNDKEFKKEFDKESRDCLKKRIKISKEIQLKSQYFYNSNTLHFNIFNKLKLLFRFINCYTK